MAKVGGRGRRTPSTGEVTFLRVIPIVAFALVVGLQFFIGSGNTTLDLAGAGPATNVEALNAPETSRAVCMFRINKECAIGADPLPHGVWFHDKDHGGRLATSRTECEARKESWKITCPETGVDMAHDADWPKVPPPPEGSPRCEMRIAAECTGHPAMGEVAGWFLDSDKGGPNATTPEECQVRKKSWEKSCEAMVELRFIGTEGDIVAVNVMDDLSPTVASRYRGEEVYNSPKWSSGISLK